ncbi:MAG: phage tail protein [Bacteroidetes bacterium]|nr:phage tail protein [Bacteroidota bacterium]
MSGGTQFYPPVSFHFRVEIAGFGNDIGFQSVDGLSIDIPVTDHAEGGENVFTHHLPNRISYKDLTLKRGMLLGSALIKWFKDAVENFQFDPKNVTVSLLDESHTPIAQWNFVNAWPKAWNIESFDASGNKIAVETIILTYQYYQRVAI